MTTITGMTITIMRIVIPTTHTARAVAVGMITDMITGTVKDTAIATGMADAAELQRLQWFSPAFPIGGYAYSHGIEAAQAAGAVRDEATLAAWIADILTLGAGRNDAILLAESWRRAGLAEPDARIAGLVALAELGIALSLSAERRLETAQQGAAFHALVGAAHPHPDLPPLAAFAPGGLPLPVAVGMAGRLHAQPLEGLLAGYLQAFAGNLVAAGIRLALIGQSAAQVRLAALRPVILAATQAGGAAGLADLGGMAFRVDLMSLMHETQESRLFRS